jgi:twitching motility two-component system response regulator PilH
MGIEPGSLTEEAMIHQPKILVVDDSPTQLEMMVRPFQNRNYDVITATDGAAALRIASQQRPALIVLDVIMPKLNGFQVCRTLKKNPDLKEIKIIMLTNKNQESDEFWGMKQGADAYFTKPFDEEELLAMVAKLLGYREESPKK